jgi:DMSO/TMAO reductase YedYZ molybdopterin-dependent catalytic subunit
MSVTAPDISGEYVSIGDNSTFRVTGRVRNDLVVGVEDLLAMDAEEIEELPIICGTGTPKGHIRKCRGVLLENIIRKAEVLKEGENDTKKMFIVASSDDGCKTVFSWQEIFNTAIGGGVMVLFERNGKLLGGKEGGLEIISTEDYFSGSRYVKGLRKIELTLVR